MGTYNLFDWTEDCLSDIEDNNKDTTKQITYSLSSIDFNDTTRIARIYFTETQRYKTIIKYVTRNYVKYPIYSDWKQKTKTIKKTIKLTNKELENLNNNNDALIRRYAVNIINKLNRKELQPSWYKKKLIQLDLDNKLKNLKNNLKVYKQEQYDIISIAENRIQDNTNEIKKYENILNKHIHKINNLKNKLEKIDHPKHKLMKIIISIGIYKYLISNKRKINIENRILQLQDKCNSLSDEISSCNETTVKYNKIIDSCNFNIQQSLIKFNKSQQELEDEYKFKRELIKPLTESVAIVNNNDFVMLKDFSGLEYKKIIGVYVLHNKEKDKYYIGQSKDVIKRIRQHFNGTIPKNCIFAEDYYTSNYNKEDLFEVKIIPCKTKDELDNLERKLIYKYDSWNNGYNGTSGNL